MTTIIETELAQWGRGFIGERDWDAVISICENEDRTDEWNLFESRYTAPILAHLAKRKMLADVMHFTEINLGNHIQIGSNENIYYCQIVRHPKMDIYETKHKNEYKALWQAIKKAVGK